MRVNIPLSISIACNLLLLGICLSGSRFAPAIDEPARQPLDLANSASASEPRLFRWSQMEADSYPAYISNLRGIGCPESTIRDIISGELSSTYAEKRQELAARAPAQPGAFAADLKKLEKEQGSLLAALLPSPPAFPAVESNGAEFSVAETNQPVNPARRHIPVAARMPLAFEPFSPAAPHSAPAPKTAAALTPAQSEAVTQLRESFLKQIGGANSDSRAPEYLDAWVKAQPELDERLRAQLGTELFNQYQINTFQPE